MMAKEVSTVHDRVAVRRTCAAPVARVYGAWRDPAALERWYGDGTWSSKVLVHDFRPGGTKKIEFGPPGGPVFLEDCRYEDIVPERRICFAMTIQRAGVPITTSMVTVELFRKGLGPTWWSRTRSQSSMAATRRRIARAVGAKRWTSWSARSRPAEEGPCVRK
jgi:uncharacterized protein YndB with AHSA1/START domain